MPHCGYCMTSDIFVEMMDLHCYIKDQVQLRTELSTKYISLSNITDRQFLHFPRAIPSNALKNQRYASDNCFREDLLTCVTAINPTLMALTELSYITCT